jgi:hypothetical protein
MGVLLLLLLLSPAAMAVEVIIKHYEDNFIITDKFSPWEPSCWGKIRNISGWHRNNVTIIVEPFDEEDRKMDLQVIEIGLMGVNGEEDFRWYPPLGMKRYQYTVKGN